MSANRPALRSPRLSDYVADFTQGATGTPFPAPGGSGNTFFGAIIGRYANRIANASFDLNGKTYTLDANNGSNTLHGGYLGWNTVVWTASTSHDWHGVSLVLTHHFPAGEGCLATLTTGCSAPTGGFPAALDATVTYTLTRDNQLKIKYQVVNDSTSDATVINLTNHTYFNLGGEGTHTIYNQLLALNSDKYTPVNTNLIPESPYFVRGQLSPGRSGRGPAQRRHPAGVHRRAGRPGLHRDFLVGDLRGTSGNVYRQGDAFTPWRRSITRTRRTTSAIRTGRRPYSPPAERSTATQRSSSP